MKKHGLIGLLLAAVIAVLSTFTALAGTPQVQIKVVLTSVSGDSTVLLPGDVAASKLNVPLRAKFVSSISSDDGNEYVMFQQWTVKRLNTETSEFEDYLKRQGMVKENENAVEEYEFSDNGSFQIGFAWSYREEDSVNAATIPGDDKESMSFSIDEAEVRLFNAFSPNGDGINDVYKIYARSIVSMKIAIFNRWGQTIKTISGKMDEILPAGAEPETDGGYLFEIWDGRFNGDIVNDGVYFINVQATGASGKTFEHKADINVLKGLGNQR